ncbi:MAG: hypothetical protein C0408_05930 [Odoribacter sp.]|nr:hypothetical protein [Odoribacter sp.]
MKNKTALVFGATGLIGNLLLGELINSNEYQEIKIFVRQSTGIIHAKVREFIFDLTNPDSFSDRITGDDIFICLGTTIKKAGSIKKMEEIDRDMPVKIASFAFANKVRRIAVVSSLGANPASSNYYLRIKGEMEREILKIEFENRAIVRPSMLLGERKERRAAETAGKVVMKVVNPLLLGKMKKYRGIHGKDVAKAMISILQTGQSKNIYESDELQRIADAQK